MSVIVKGMKMPKNCLHCDFDDSYGICACRNEAPYVCEYSAKQRPSWCPLEDLPSAQEKRTEERTETHACDCISRQDAIDAVEWGITYARAINTCTGETKELFRVSNYALKEATERIKELPPAQPETHEKRTETHECDLIDRQDVIDGLLCVVDDGGYQMTDKPCAFCDALMRNKNIRALYNQRYKEEHEEKIYEDYTVALVVRSYVKGKKRTAGRTTDYRNRGIGYQLNFCPECGRKLTGEK